MGHHGLFSREDEVIRELAWKPGRQKQRFWAVWDQQPVSEADPKRQVCGGLLALGGEESIQERVGQELSLN